MKTITETKHTPTPLVQLFRGSQRPGNALRQPVDVNLVKRDETGSETNATIGELHPKYIDFIVRAVNSHEALLGYVKDLLEFERARMSSHGLKNYPAPSLEYIGSIEKAIAQAEGK